MNTPRRLGAAAVAALAAAGPFVTPAGGRTALAADATQTLRLDARASLLDNIGATAEIRLNGNTVGSIQVDSTTWREYEVSVPALQPSDRIDVRFANDNARDGQDRNLYIRSITDGLTHAYVSDPQTRYDRGSDWGSSTDGRQTFPGQTTMWWNGAMRFVWPSTAPIQALSTEATPAPPTQAPSGTPNVADPSPAAVTPSPGAVTPFAADSFWYKPLPKDTPLHPRSADFAANLVNDTRNNVATVNTRAYAPPIYIADASTTRVKVNYENCTGAQNDDAWLTKNWSKMFDLVPLPASPVPAAGEDAEMVVWSPSTNEVWEMWRFKAGANDYSACWGGKLSDMKASDGVFTYPFGVTAGGLSLLGGTIRVEELRAGRINHVIAIGINRPRRGVYSWPANRTDGTWDDERAIPEGLRLRLDPSLDVDSLKISPIAKIIAKAAQEYGFIVRDNTNGPLVIYAEDANSYMRAGKGNPYTEMFGAEYWYWMEEFPWDRIQGMPLDYGKP